MQDNCCVVCCRVRWEQCGDAVSQFAFGFFGQDDRLVLADGVRAPESLTLVFGMVVHGAYSEIVLGASWCVGDVLSSIFISQYVSAHLKSHACLENLQ